MKGSIENFLAYGSALQYKASTSRMISRLMLNLLYWRQFWNSDVLSTGTGKSLKVAFAVAFFTGLMIPIYDINMIKMNSILPENNI